MNPKEMKNETIIVGLSAALQVEGNRENNPDDRIYALKYRQRVEAELLRRLDERDALRKDNEELRKNMDKLLKDYAELKVNAALLVACDDALEDLESGGEKEGEVRDE